MAESSTALRIAPVRSFVLTNERPPVASAIFSIASMPIGWSDWAGVFEIRTTTTTIPPCATWCHPQAKGRLSTSWARGQSPDKRGNRTSGILPNRFAGNATTQACGRWRPPLLLLQQIHGPLPNLARKAFPGFHQARRYLHRQQTPTVRLSSGHASQNGLLQIRNASHDPAT